ncbi:MAG: RecB family exonuclease [Nanoarchaeota archaeon]
MKLYSHSRLSCYEQCPLKFKYQYIDNIQPERGENIEAFMGSRVHEALEKLYKDLSFEKAPELLEILDYYNKRWQEEWRENIVVVREEYSPENYRKMGERYITDYFHTYKPFNQSKTIALETAYTVPIDKEGNYKMHVKIDRLSENDGIFEIHDYKTSNTLPGQDYFDNERQLALYAYGVKYKFPKAQKIRLIWHYLAFNKEMVSTRSDEELENLRQVVLDLIHEIENTQEFPSRESALCNWCEYKSLCPRFRHLELKEENTVEYEGGKELVDKYAELDREIKQKQEELEKVKEKLKTYAEKNKIENVYGSGKRAFVKSYESLQFPRKNDSTREDFLNTIKNMDIYDYIATVDTYELAKMINGGKINSEELEKLEPFINKAKITRIYLKDI